MEGLHRMHSVPWRHLLVVVMLAVLAASALVFMVA
jgi:hypothetical protein